MSTSVDPTRRTIPASAGSTVHPSHAHRRAADHPDTITQFVVDAACSPCMRGMILDRADEPFKETVHQAGELWMI